jgi:hypothetical protein
VEQSNVGTWDRDKFIGSPDKSIQFAFELDGLIALQRPVRLGRDRIVPTPPVELGIPDSLFDRARRSLDDALPRRQGKWRRRSRAIFFFGFDCFSAHLEMFR